MYIYLDVQSESMVQLRLQHLRSPAEDVLIDSLRRHLNARQGYRYGPPSFQVSVCPVGSLQNSSCKIWIDAGAHIQYGTLSNDDHFAV